jgi:hypothetical protein
MSGARSRYASGDPSSGTPAEDLSAPTPPAPQSLASTATTASLTWTHAGAPGGTTYALTVVDEAGASVSPSSGSGLGPYVIPVASGKAYTARLRATGTDGQVAQSSALVQVTPDIATDFPLEGAAGWRVVYSADLTDQGSQGPLAAGAGTITVDGASIAYLGNIGGGAGTFGTGNAATVSADGVKIVASATSNMLPQLTLTIPLGETWGPDVSLRIRALVRFYCGDSTDSVFLYMSAPDVSLAYDVASTTKTAGIRMLGTTTSAYTRRGGAPSGVSTKPTAWVGGSTDLYVEFLLAPYANDVIIFVDDAAFNSGSSDLTGRSQSRDANPTVTLPIWQDGAYDSFKLMLAFSNGGAGTTLPSIALKALQVELR